jgi:hypothetical protein
MGHSVANQLTYIKKLDTVAKVNTDDIANLSSIYKCNMISSHEKFQQIARDILWLNLTLHGQSDLFMTIRELQLAILRLIQQLDELMSAVQYTIVGKLPLNLVDPTTLHSIKKITSLA